MLGPEMVMVKAEKVIPEKAIMEKEAMKKTEYTINLTSIILLV